MPGRANRCGTSTPARRLLLHRSRTASRAGSTWPWRLAQTWFLSACLAKIETNGCGPRPASRVRRTRQRRSSRAFAEFLTGAKSRGGLLGLVQFPVEHKELIMHAAILVCRRCLLQVPQGFVKLALCGVHLAQQHVRPSQLGVELEALAQRGQRFLCCSQLDQRVTPHQVCFGIQRVELQNAVETSQGEGKLRLLEIRAAKQVVQVLLARFKFDSRLVFGGSFI